MSGRPTNKPKTAPPAENPRLEYWRNVEASEPEWADRPGADWEDPEYMAWVESWTKADTKRLGKGLVGLSKKARRKR